MAVPTLYLTGTGTGTGTPLGQDGMCDQFLSGGTTWTQVDTTTQSGNGYNSTPVFSPVNGRIYEFGNGDGANPCQYYDVGANTWNNATNLPTGCFGQGAGARLGKIAYCIGGLGAPGSPALAVNKIYSYDMTQTGGAGDVYVTSYAVCPDTVCSSMAVAVGNLIYHGGGDSGDGVGTPTAHWYSWDPITPTRTTLTSMPTARFSSANVELNGIIYIIGGGTTGDTNYQGSTVVYAYSIANNTWATKNAYPISVSMARACVWKGVIYCAGGFNASGFSNPAGTNATTNIYAYNPVADSWTLQSAHLTQALVGSILVLAPNNNSDLVPMGGGGRRLTDHPMLRMDGATSPKRTRRWRKENSLWL